MMTNKYFEIVKTTTIDYIENRINAEEFKETFQKLDEIDVYEDLERNDYKGISNYISAVAEIDDQSTLESQWIVNIINDFYAYFTDNYSYIYSKDFYRFLKSSLNKENKNPVKIGFNKAIEGYFKKEISSDCLAYIANEYLNNLKFFQEEIKEDKELFNVLTTASKLKPNKLLEDLTPEEHKVKQNVDNVLKKYLN